MSSISGGNPALTLPQFDSASIVLGKIETQTGTIRSLSDQLESIQSQISNLRALIEELRAQIGPPPQRVGDDASFAREMEKYREKLSSVNEKIVAIQGKIQDLNDKLTKVHSKLGAAQRKLSKLQLQDLPAAERRDAQKMQRAMETAREALDSEVKKAATACSNSEEDKKAEEKRIELRAEQRAIEIKLDDGTSIKELIQVFVLAVGAGMPKPQNSFTAMPSTPGTGLPPVNIP